MAVAVIDEEVNIRRRLQGVALGTRPEVFETMCHAPIKSEGRLLGRPGQVSR